MHAKYGNVKRGIRDDLGMHFNSGWEADIARFLNLLQHNGVIEGWAYEPQTFYFQGLGYKNGAMMYKPDFVVTYSSKIPRSYKKILTQILDEVHPGRSVFIEVKGQELSKDRTKWKRFREHSGYPLEVIKRDKMYTIQEMFRHLIPEWESNIRV